jgi:hypothetical protein
MYIKQLIDEKSNLVITIIFYFPFIHKIFQFVIWIKSRNVVN